MHQHTEQACRKKEGEKKNIEPIYLNKRKMHE